MKLKLLSLSALVTLLFSCSKKDTPGPADPCDGVSFTINTTHTEAVGGASNGTITVLEPRGDTISYKLNNGNFQTSWYFSNLSAGNYVITIKNQQGCTDTAQVTILNYGPKYALVKQIITGYCGPCHLNGTINGGMNFDTDAAIVAAKDRIKVRTVDGIPTFMPQGSELTPVDKQKILDWVNAGGTTTVRSVAGLISL
jgi:uncharacterized membrane protein